MTLMLRNPDVIPAPPDVSFWDLIQLLNAEVARLRAEGEVATEAALQQLACDRVVTALWRDRGLEPPPKPTTEEAARIRASNAALVKYYLDRGMIP